MKENCFPIPQKKTPTSLGTPVVKREWRQIEVNNKTAQPDKNSRIRKQNTPYLRKGQNTLGPKLLDKALVLLCLIVS